MEKLGEKAKPGEFSDFANSASPTGTPKIFVLSILTVGTVAGIYLWWKTRGLRKRMGEHSTYDVVVEGILIGGRVIEGEVIEGEVISKVDSGERNDR